MVPTVAIHCIVRPPWICPGAPACSGNTQWTPSVTLSAIESMGGEFFYHAHPIKSSRAVPARPEDDGPDTLLADREAASDRLAPAPFTSRRGGRTSA